VPYKSFHAGYRKTQLEADELIRAVCLGRRFSDYYSYVRKVGTRNAQAIAKLSLAGLGLIRDGVIEDVRLAMGSVAPVPIRLTETEGVLKGKRIGRESVNTELVRLASRTAAAEIRPIDDIRSTARYRAAVTGNLVAEFLEQLGKRQP